MSKLFEDLIKQAEEESKETKAHEKKETKAEEKKEEKNKYREKIAEMIIGGEADYAPNSDFDAEELLEGAEEELEHTDNLDQAIEIAKDHLKEMPDYYERLEEMEEEAEEEGAKKPEEIGKEAMVGALARTAKSMKTGTPVPSAAQTRKMDFDALKGRMRSRSKQSEGLKKSLKHGLI